MRTPQQDFRDRPVIWISILICTPAAPMLGCVAFLLGGSLPAALAIYLAACLIPAGVVLARVTAARVRAQPDLRPGGPDRGHPIGCRHPAPWSFAK